MTDNVIVRIAGGLLRSVWLRCPHCRRAPLLRHPFAAHERCRVCGLAFERDSGDFWGTVVLAYAAGSVAGLAALGLLLERGVEHQLFLASTASAAATVVILLVFPFARSFWIALLYHTRGSYEEYRPPEQRPEP